MAAAPPELIELLPVQAWYAAADGRMRFQNRACREFGAPAPQWTEAIHPHDRARYDGALTRLQATTGPVEAELRLRRADGCYRWFLVRMAPAGAPGECYGTNADIDDLKEGSGETEAMLEFTLSSAQIGDWDLDLVHDTSRRSLRHDQCFGYSSAIPEDQWGIEVFVAHVHPLDRDRIDSGLRGAAQGQHDWSDEFRVVWPDGSVHWLAARGSIYSSHEGRATRMLGIVSDISARKRSEEALTASEQIARGQVVALTQTLDALALDDTPDRLAQHISRTITAQLGANSNSVWRRNEVNGRIGFEFAFEGGSFVSKSDPRIAGASLWLPMDESLPWPAPLREGRHCLLEDIRTVRSFELRDRLVEMGIVTVLMVPMLICGRLDGVIAIRYAHKREFRPDEIEFAKTLANQAVLALQLTRLSAERRDLAVTAERNRMARDMHDTLAQGFTGVIVQLDAALDGRRRGLHAQADAHVERAGALARASLTEARRSVLALRPQALEDSDVGGALAAMFERLTGGTALAADFVKSGAPRAMPAAWEDNIVRIGQEALTNTLRHAGARRVEAALAFTDGGVRLTIRDDGRGFDPAAPHDGFGLLGMRERAEQMGAALAIDSAQGQGTAVTISVPLAPSLIHKD
jgi:PAS domain S-box-containing protein